MDKRKNKRFTAPLRVKLNSGSLIALGMLCDVSENGLFVKSNRDFTMDAAISIEIFMPDNVNSLLRGTVKRKIELSEPYRKHGFGIEIIEKDSLYPHFIRFLLDRGKDLRKLVFSEQESRHRKIKSELQERCRLFDVVAFFIGEQSKQDQLLGKVWFEAKMKNNTNYTFKVPIVIFMTITNTNNHHIQNDQSNSYPEVGVVMISSINDVSWKPDETILFTGEIDISSEDVLDYERAFIDYLAKTFEFVQEEAINIDNYISTLWIASPYLDVDSQFVNTIQHS